MPINIFLYDEKEIFCFFPFILSPVLSSILTAHIRLPAYLSPQFSVCEYVAPEIHKSILPSFLPLSLHASFYSSVFPSFCPSLQASQYVYSYFFPMKGSFSFSMYVRLFSYLPSAVSFPLNAQLSLSPLFTLRVANK